MSNTHHHRKQRDRHLGHDYGSRVSCNKNYAQSYGKQGRKRAAEIRRMETKKIIREEIQKSY